MASYPCVVQNNILWFYPRPEPEHKDVLQRKPPSMIPVIEDPEAGDHFYHFGVLVTVINRGKTCHLYYSDLLYAAPDVSEISSREIEKINVVQGALGQLIIPFAPVLSAGILLKENHAAEFDYKQDFAEFRFIKSSRSDLFYGGNTGMSHVASNLNNLEN
ncbi:protochlorophyllide-dependent translocon component 52, chloroplastic-like [Panicum miliaceum]|uniref:Protochlorophyllide-dependent translocon component 52, chloroplastic-like n=1 Tax=Panicum miliaceum TaxID=4540 RepID=A0A3L6PVP5_PANMI|nr:protochlorophyllide-dependent translocon component 52, chloroplastic-like [Panicum miliaceum]